MCTQYNTIQYKTYIAPYVTLYVIRRREEGFVHKKSLI